jgi:hypothetical protein
MFGCFYFSDDIPFSFQNITDNLSEDGKNRWKWEKDSHNGYTSKMFDDWYYFKVSNILKMPLYKTVQRLIFIKDLFFLRYIFLQGKRIHRG